MIIEEKFIILKLYLFVYICKVILIIMVNKDKIFVIF